MNTQCYIHGAWRRPAAAYPQPVFDPATEEAYETISWATPEDVNHAVDSARDAFAGWGLSDKAERIDALQRLIAVYQRRSEEMAAVISREMGAPIDLARKAQAAAGLGHLKAFVGALEELPLASPFRADTPQQHIAREPAGVAALITPWNWPMNQVCLKVGAALAAGCTMVLKPSEIAPLSASLFAEFVDEAGLPPGVFNLVNGDGAGVGSALVAHPEVDVISFTGSTRAGVAISQAAAEGIKRVSLELGGKSPNLIFADCELEQSLRYGAAFCFLNSGQSCNAPTRMLVERSVYQRAVEIAAQVADETRVDLPSEPGGHIGPLVSQAQFDKVQRLIDRGMGEGARLVAGGPGRAEGFERGWFARPTVFADVGPRMSLWREEIFGPVLTITPFDSEEEAIELANDTPYGLAAYLQTGDAERARRVGRRLRAGMVQINRANRAPGMPFGGYKMSGIGREGGVWGIEEFLEVKSYSGWPAE